MREIVVVVRIAKRDREKEYERQKEEILTHVIITYEGSNDCERFGARERFI